MRYKLGKNGAERARQRKLFTGVKYNVPQSVQKMGHQRGKKYMNKARKTIPFYCEVR